MKIKLFNYRKSVLCRKATWSESRFLRILMAALLLCSMNSQALAASGANTDANTPPPESADRFNAASFLGASNPDDDQHWTLWGDAGVVLAIVGIAAITVKGYQYYCDRQKTIDQGEKESHLRDVTGDIRGGDLGDGGSSPSAGGTDSEDLSDGKGSLSSSESEHDTRSGPGGGLALDSSEHPNEEAALTTAKLEDLKSQLLALHQLRKSREENSASNGSTAESSSYWQYLFGKKQQVKILDKQNESVEVMREQHEFNLGQCRNQLTCDSDLDAIKFAFTGEAKKKLAEVLKAISADDANEEKQKKFAFFAAKKDLSADHLNGYLEALDKSENHQAILDQMQLFVDSYWARKEKQLVVTASAVQSPSGSYVASSQVLEQVGEQDGNLSSGGKSKVLKKEEQTSGLEDSYIITPRKRNAPTCNSANYETDEESDL